MNDDLISRRAALDAIDKNRQVLLSLGMCGIEHILVHYGRRVIEELPTIDPVKHGKWMRTPTWWAYCSVCGMEPPNESNETTDYCPNCGAKMDKEE